MTLLARWRLYVDSLCPGAAVSWNGLYWMGGLGVNDGAGGG